jgi:hypothetical protein
MIGGVGTLAYYVLGYLAMRLTVAINPQASPLPVALMLIPLLPGMIPGGLVALLFSTDGFHGTSFFVGSLISAPIVNSVFVYFWMKSRFRAESSK